MIDFYNGQDDKMIAALREGNEKRAEKTMTNHLKSAKMHRYDLLKEFSELF